MLKDIYVVTDIGPGDGGKGSIIHFLSQKVDASIIIKRGGAQGSHGVRTSQNEKFNFSQWGCSTFEGVPTYCSPQMIISPVGLKNESDALKHHGIYDPFTLISFNPDCICATPYHMISSQLEELSLGKNHRGTIGTGVGRAYRMYNQFGIGISIKAADLKYPDLIKHKLQMQMEYYREIYQNMPKDNGIPEDAPLISENLNLLYDDGLLDYTTSLFTEIGKQIKLEAFSEILKMEGDAIVECSHGVLTDSNKGIRPHVSAIRTLPVFTENMLRSEGFQGRIINLAVHRAYEVRHGAGPMPTYDPYFTNQMLPDSHKEDNRWQGKIRAGALDINLLKYSLLACDETHFDGICLTWMDQILSQSRIWKLCTDYVESYKLSQSYKDYLENATPVVEGILIPKFDSSEQLFNFINEIVIEYVDVPLKILSIGSTEKDKIMKN